MEIVATDWDSCARFLGRALCRYNGLTNSAKLELISDVVAGKAVNEIGDGLGDLFQEKPFCYAYEIIKQFEDVKGGVRPRSAEVHMHHAIAFGFLLRTFRGGKAQAYHKGKNHRKLSSKLESTTHIALAPLGRAYRSASVLPNQEAQKFKSLIWNYALLERDFDMYGLLIKLTEENSGNLPSVDDFFEKFYDIKYRQVDWLKEKFPYTGRRTDIQRNMQCIGRRIGEGKHGRKRVFALDTIFPFGEDYTKGHHYSQRKRWADKFGHISKGHLTESGRDLSRHLPPIDVHPFFWLGPPIPIARAHFLSAAAEDIDEKLCSPAWNMLIPMAKMEENNVDSEIVDVVADYMDKSFDVIRLKNFAQASLDVVVPYVHFVERERLLSGNLSRRVDMYALFREIFREHRDKFVCTLRRDLSKSHYWLRERR